MYSQNNEEEIITKFLDGQAGSFLDIGAYDGKCFSNTLRLVEIGWSGLCLEPSMSVFPALQKLHEGNPRVICIPKAFAKTDGKVKFYDSGGDAISSTNYVHKVKWERGYPGCKFKECQVDTISLDTLLKLIPVGWPPVMFLNLDVEGTSATLFFDMDLSRLPSLQLICIEHDHREAEVRAKAKEHGFTTELLHNSENLILVKPRG
jgi:FkbM family methyltransferase